MCFFIFTLRGDTQTGRRERGVTGVRGAQVLIRGGGLEGLEQRATPPIYHPPRAQEGLLGRVHGGSTLR